MTLLWLEIRNQKHRNGNEHGNNTVSMVTVSLIGTMGSGPILPIKLAVAVNAMLNL